MGFTPGKRNSFNRKPIEEGPPDRVIEVGEFLHSCEGDLVIKMTNEKIPYFNAPIYLENKTQIGKVDEIFGAINDTHVSVKCDVGIKADSFKAHDKVFINPEKLLERDRFLKYFIFI